MIYIGAGEIISPLGESLEENFSAICENRSGISLTANAGFNGDTLPLARITGVPDVHKFENLLLQAMSLVLRKIDATILTSDKLIVLISSTKGELDRNITNQFGQVSKAVASHFGLANQPLVISNACISGVLAINAAGNFIRAGLYDHAIVLGCDVISDFVVYGFQSLFAISDKICAPFDAKRKGISLGEGCGAVVISSSEMIFKNKPLKLLKGTSANDANHISGPSRTGEGLYRSVKKTLAINDIAPGQIDFISAHGTATVYNDEMESIAFDRLALNHVPLNSLKGYFGHTLGAAGVIETVVSMQMMQQGVLIKSLGFEDPGTSAALNVIRENKTAGLDTILKTASGFGGGNASLIIQKL